MQSVMGVFMIMMTIWTILAVIYMVFATVTSSLNVWPFDAAQKTLFDRENQTRPITITRPLIVHCYNGRLSNADVETVLMKRRVIDVTLSYDKTQDMIFMTSVYPMPPNPESSDIVRVLVRFPIDSDPQLCPSLDKQGQLSPHVKHSMVNFLASSTYKGLVDPRSVLTVNSVLGAVSPLYGYVPLDPGKFKAEFPNAAYIKRWDPSSTSFVSTYNPVFSETSSACLAVWPCAHDACPQCVPADDSDQLANNIPVFMYMKNNM